MPKPSKQVNLDLSKKISIRQYCDPEVKNMGLEQYNLSLFSGANGEGGIKEDLGYREIGDKRFYLTGLEPERASHLDDLPEDVREARKLEIEAARKHLAEYFSDETLDCRNESFWKTHFIELKRPVIELDLKDYKDLMTYYAILAGGYTEIAPSFQHAKTANKIYKFYLHQDIEVADIKVELTKLRAKATTLLENLDNEDPDKMFKVAKLLLPIEKGYTNRTPKSQVYSDIYDYIQGAYNKNDVKSAPRKLIEIYALDRATLNIKAIIRESLHQNFIIKNSEQVFINPSTQRTLGRNETEILAYLLNPINAEELTVLHSKVNVVWN